MPKISQVNVQEKQRLQKCFCKTDCKIFYLKNLNYLFFKQVFVRLAMKEQIAINVILDTMVMELHVLSVALTRLHQQVVVLQLQQIVS